MTACPNPLPPAYVAWEKWRLAGGVKAERPRGLPQRIPQGWWKCLQERRPKPAATLGVYERVAFFINPTAGSPVGGAREILAGAEAAGVTLYSFNSGDSGDWREWFNTTDMRTSWWARCDSEARRDSLAVGKRNIANIESPEINDGSCTPGIATLIVTGSGAIITESEVPHADWRPVAAEHMPIFIEIDPNVPAVRDNGIGKLVEYGRNVTGNQLVVPAFFITQNAWWDGSQATFETYWDLLREQWGGPFALYAAENVPDWKVIR